jgi:hypothetical protein
MLSRTATLLVLACALASPAGAQAPARAGATIGTCALVETDATEVVTPVELRAVGSCDLGGQGGTATCTAEIVPTAADLVLDVSDRSGEARCLRLAGDDPCTFVQNGPVIFQSDRRAAQTFSASADRVRMTTMIRQKRIGRTITDRPPGASFPLLAGRSFDVLRRKSAAAARLDCSMTDGDRRIFPLVGDADPGPRIAFVSRNAADPLFDVITYRVK